MSKKRKDAPKDEKEPDAMLKDVDGTFPRRSARLMNNSSTIIRPDAVPGLKRGREEGEGEVKVVTPKPKRKMQRPYLMSMSIVKAASESNLPRVMLLHQKYRISLDSVNELSKVYNRWSVLIWATFLRNEAMIDYALANQCNVDHQDNDGFTALHWAAFYGYVNIARKLLVTGGADDTLTNRWGETALQGAIIGLGNQHKIVSQWESLKRAARVERARQDLEDRMIVSLQCSNMIADEDTLLSDFCLRFPEMMLPVMYAFTGEEILKDLIENKL